MAATHSVTTGITHVEVTDFQGLSACVSPRLNQEQAARTIGSINAFMHQVFMYGRNWRVILDALRTDITCLLANVFATDYFIAKEDIQSALLCLKRAKANKKLYASRLSERENLYLAAYDAWLSGKPNLALLHFSSILKIAPQDLFAAKRAQLMAFILGDAQTMLSVLTQPSVEKACSKRPYYHGMLSFALEQNDLLAEAYAAARIGVEICPEDPWAHHAVAHALYFQGRLRTGLDFLLAASPHWTNCMSFMLTHNWFHIALIYMDLNDFARVMISFDHGLWRHPDLEKLEPAYCVESLLEKLEFRLGADNSNDKISLNDALNVIKMHEKYLKSPLAKSLQAIQNSSFSTDSGSVEVKAPNGSENSLLPPALQVDQPLMKNQDKDYSQDFLGAAGLLWKLELRVNGTCGVRAETKFVRKLLRDTLNFEDRLVGGTVAQSESKSSQQTSKKSGGRSKKNVPPHITAVPAATLFGLGASNEHESKVENEFPAVSFQLTSLLPVPDPSKSGETSEDRTIRRTSNERANTNSSNSSMPLLHCLRIPVLDSRWHDIALHAKVPSTHADPFCDIMTAHALGRAGLIGPLKEHVASARVATLAIPVRKRRAQLMISLVPMLEAILAFHTHDFVLAWSWLAPVFGFYPPGNMPPSPDDVIMYRSQKRYEPQAEYRVTQKSSPLSTPVTEDTLVSEVMGSPSQISVNPEKSEATWDVYMNEMGHMSPNEGPVLAKDSHLNQQISTRRVQTPESSRFFSHSTFAKYSSEAGNSLPEKIQAVGGSREQREVFSEFYIEILFAVGDLEEILRILDRKIRSRPIPYLHMLRSQAYSLLQKQALFALDLVSRGYHLSSANQLLNAATLGDNLLSDTFSEVIGLNISMSANEVASPLGRRAERVGSEKSTNIEEATKESKL